MSTSSRATTMLGVLIGGLAALALPATPAGAATPPVTVQVTPVTTTPTGPGGTASSSPGGPAGTIDPAPAYRIEVRNAGDTPVRTTVRQELPEGASPTMISPGGRTTRAGAHTAGQPRGTEVTWQLNLPARGVRTLHTELAPVRTNTPLTAPACAFIDGGDMPYDCATASWTAPRPAEPAKASTPWWRRPPAFWGGIGATALLVSLGAGWWWRRRAARRRAASGGSGPDPATTPPVQSESAPVPAPVRPWPPNSDPGGERRRSTLLSVGLAGVLLVGTVSAVTWAATDRVTAINTERPPSSGAWIGTTSTGPLGTALRDSVFEFTVYRLACDRAGPGQRCLATVRLHNVSGRSQLWHGKLQRAYLPDGNWVSADEPATLAANQGRNPFAEPVPAGEHILIPLVFTTDGSTPPVRIELRGEVFSAGVSVDVP